MDHDRVLREVVGWATGNENVRLAVLTGSAAFDTGYLHPLSDLDIELFVRDPAELLKDREWYGQFGDLLAVEELENVGWNPTRLAYFVDGKIDFMIGGLGALEAGVTYPRGYRVLVDKDGLSKRLTRDATTAAPPAPDEFRRCVDWFTAAALMEGKAIVRDEPWMAKIRDRDLKAELLTMIEWDHRSRYGWEFDTWHMGVHMRDWMDADVQASLERCWPGSLRRRPRSR